MAAALSLAEQGFPVDLVEKEAALGGNLRSVFTSTDGSDPQAALRHLIERIDAHPRVRTHLQSRVVHTSGFKGNFVSEIETAAGDSQSIKHGAVILATGGEEYRGAEYSYGTDPRVVTQQEFEAILHAGRERVEEIRSVVMIQCVGPAEKYCSRICCTVALKNALALKAQNPGAKVVVLYRDIRIYGFKEQIYTEARRQGVLFVRYDPERAPEVSINGGLKVVACDPILGRELALTPDLVVLSMPVVPRPETQKLAAMYKVPLDADGFFLEAHVKLRPVDFPSDGVFMAGMAHYPKLLDETMIQAQAAAARASRILSRDTMTAGGQVAVVDPSLCTGCLTCVRICPFGVPSMRADLAGIGGIQGAAYVEPTVCQGCGSCVAECPARAIQLMHYTDIQMMAKVDALFHPAPALISLDEIGLPDDLSS
jgi:heterodisulfide reductase subunit A